MRIKKKPGQFLGRYIRLIEMFINTLPLRESNSLSLESGVNLVCRGSDVIWYHWWNFLKTWSFCPEWFGALFRYWSQKVQISFKEKLCRRENKAASFSYYLSAHIPGLYLKPFRTCYTTLTNSTAVLGLYSRRITQLVPDQFPEWRIYMT